MLTFRNFSKSYGRHRIINLPFLEIPAGIHWLKGKNGSGKTTLFRALAGLLPYSGDILYKEELLGPANPLRHRQLISYAEAEPVYPEFLNGQDLLHLFAKARKASSPQIQHLTETLDLGSSLSKPVATYSSGMLKKLSLMLAFLGKPAWILLDEPLITLDEATTDQVLELIMAYHQQGTSFLLSSHQDLEMPQISLATTWIIRKGIIKTLEGCPDA